MEIPSLGQGTLFKLLGHRSVSMPQGLRAGLRSLAVEVARDLVSWPGHFRKDRPREYAAQRITLGRMGKFWGAEGLHKSILGCY